MNNGRLSNSGSSLIDRDYIDISNDQDYQMGLLIMN